MNQRETITSAKFVSGPRYGFLPVDVEGFDSLVELAPDMRWSWNHAADEMRKQLDPVLWDLTHNPWLSRCFVVIKSSYRNAPPLLVAGLRALLGRNSPSLCRCLCWRGHYK